MACENCTSKQDRATSKYDSNAAAQRQLCVQDHVSIHARFSFGLDEISEAALYSSLQLNGFARPSGSPDFDISQSGQLEVGQGRDFWITLRNRTGQLRRSLDQQYSRQQRVPGEMAF